MRIQRICKHKNGFTLPELLIVLAILGVLAAFTIPKILNSQQNQQSKAIFRETFSALNSMIHGGVLLGELDRSNFREYALEHLNYVVSCPNDSQAEGCWPTDGITDSVSVQEGLVLHNGAMICGIRSHADGSATKIIYLDWNGLAGPNLIGEDEIRIRINFRTSGSGRAGTITPLPDSVSLFSEIFEN